MESFLPPVHAEKILSPIPPPATPVSPNIVAWDELQILQRQGQKGSLLRGIVLLIVSLVLFAGFGTRQWNWQRCALIIGILFVHELGHYAAMRWFKYRELRMFFIPLFGAAVTGRHFNVPGWKKAIVSLMGPLPGILIGTGLAVVGITSANDRLVNAAALVIGLNLFNLAPILPLDGGWFWNAMLFCRHRWLEAAFQVVAGLVCFAASTRGLGKVWLYLGIVMVIKVPNTLRLGAIASRLRRERWQPGGDDFVSEEMAARLFHELQTKPRKIVAKPKVLAAEALSVFEKMNASPPNWLESVGLSALYAVAIVVAMVGLGFASLFSRGADQARSTTAALAAPKHMPVLDSQFGGEVLHIAASKPARDNEPQVFFYATYPDASAAEANFSELRSSLEARDTLLRFGQTLVASTVTKPSNKEHARQIREKLRQSGNLIATGDGYTWAQCDLAFTVADEATAKRLQRELDLTFRLPSSFQPAPLWNQTSPPQNSEAMLNARATYLRVVELQHEAIKDATLSRTQRRNAITDLFTWRDSAKDWGKIAAERRGLERKAIVGLQKSGDRNLDQEVLTLMLRQPRTNDRDDQETWQAEMRRILTGNAEPPVMVLDEEEGETYAERVTGFVTLKGNRVILTGLAFQHADRSFAELATWLTSSGFTDVRYGFYDGAAEFTKQRALASK